MNHSSYQDFTRSLENILPKARIITDYAKRFAYGTDASFYRLTPQVVLQVDSEAELVQVIEKANQFKLAITYRAAGTSLSGQAQSDSILVMLTNKWRSFQIADLGDRITLGPGVIGADANKYLLPYNRKIGPDPASINTCKVGGIVANNASGMCCGVAQNSYHTLSSIRIILHDGTILDTGDKASVAAFEQSHGMLLAKLKTLANGVKLNEELHQLIKHKYRLKNTTGYAINALVDFDDPVDMLAHLFVGSEGTLGFISSITLNTVPEYKHRASSLVFFPNINVTCEAVSALAKENVSAVELLDRRSLASVSDMEGLPDFIKTLDDDVAALLIETRAANQDLLAEQISQLKTCLTQFEQTNCIDFTADANAYSKLWAIRKQTFPAVGAVRESGTTVIIEDVAFPVEQLAQGVSDLQALFDKYHYDEAIIFGHALEGNLHFVFTQEFASQTEIDRYAAFMDDVCQLVAVKYQGSLKAEHGTGRNMAPYVELEWGKQGYQLMEQIKALFDPDNLLNPGVIINDNPQAHISSLKGMPIADDIVDKCIECGFCEPVCPSKDLSFTPRQRIASYREIKRLERSNENPQQLKQMRDDFQYLGVDTCAATGLCEERCPVNINTGDLIRQIRHSNNSGYQGLSQKLANKFALVESITKMSLASVAVVQKIIGSSALAKISGVVSTVSFNKIPRWTAAMPNKANYQPQSQPQPQASTVQAPAVNIEKSSALAATANLKKVVYFPSCASRNMGAAVNASEQRSLTEVTLSLLAKAGFEVISPDFSGFCCGMPFNSKGMFEQADDKRLATADFLYQVSEQGQLPILFDTSPCKSMMLESEEVANRLNIVELAGFIEDTLSQYLTFSPTDEPVMLHVTCSSQRMGLAQTMLSLAKRCSNNVTVPEHIQCCGFAGDKGFTLPELNASALAPLKAQIPSGCTKGYSNSRTCEIGLSQHSGIDYQSIAYLVDKVTN
ncbi:FAD-binding and (Fe-S)-binding domain-containing protein [Thalassotalea sp. PLHSN55]|uniref:FAD-binding and (Fe-S)-binding domain-containing protein n=1 Tax=Thalassotalea sp. PLHSN55 TaxID=3435888 RepID=UPI003F8593A6